MISTAPAAWSALVTAITTAAAGVTPTPVIYDTAIDANAPADSLIAVLGVTDAKVEPHSLGAQRLEENYAIEGVVRFASGEVGSGATVRAGAFGLLDVVGTAVDADHTLGVPGVILAMLAEWDAATYPQSNGLACEITWRVTVQAILSP